MPRTNAQHRKPTRFSSLHAVRSARHRKKSLVASLVSGRPALVTAVASTTLILGAGAAFAVTSWPSAGPQSGQSQASLAGTSAITAQRRSDAARAHDRPLAASAVEPKAAASAAAPKPRASGPKAVVHKQPAKAAAAVTSVYGNPLREVKGLLLERVDMGADFGGMGPIYAIGNAIVTNATGNSPGWPGGGWITYQLTNGPAKGLQVYLAEDVKPTVQVGQHVTQNTVIANMYVGGSGIETGWAMPDGASAESQLPAAGAISGGGPFPTKIGLNFDAMLQATGVGAAPSFGMKGSFGTLPPNYPTDWSSLRTKSS